MRGYFNPEIFLKVAKEIKDNKSLDEQRRFRTSIGRAYYAAFLKTREHLSYRGYSFDKDHQHQDVLDALDDLNQNNLKTWLDNLRDNRVNADYFLSKVVHEGLCEKSLILSEEIINSIEGI